MDAKGQGLIGGLGKEGAGARLWSRFGARPWGTGGMAGAVACALFDFKVEVGC